MFVLLTRVSGWALALPPLLFMIRSSRAWAGQHQAPPPRPGPGLHVPACTAPFPRSTRQDGGARVALGYCSLLAPGRGPAPSSPPVAGPRRRLAERSVPGGRDGTGARLFRTSSAPLSRARRGGAGAGSSQPPLAWPDPCFPPGGCGAGAALACLLFGAVLAPAASGCGPVSTFCPAPAFTKPFSPRGGKGLAWAAAARVLHRPTGEGSALETSSWHRNV